MTHGFTPESQRPETTYPGLEAGWRRRRLGRLGCMPGLVTLIVVVALVVTLGLLFNWMR